MEPLGLWAEPVDCENGGPEFFERARNFLLTKNRKFDDSETLKKVAECLVALFGTATLSGNQELILLVLDVVV